MNHLTCWCSTYESHDHRYEYRLNKLEKHQTTDLQCQSLSGTLRWRGWIYRNLAADTDNRHRLQVLWGCVTVTKVNTRKLGRAQRNPPFKLLGLTHVTHLPIKHLPTTGSKSTNQSWLWSQQRLVRVSWSESQAATPLKASSVFMDYFVAKNQCWFHHLATSV